MNRNVDSSKQIIRTRYWPPNQVYWRGCTVMLQAFVSSAMGQPFSRQESSRQLYITWWSSRWRDKAAAWRRTSSLCACRPIVALASASFAIRQKRPCGTANGEEHCKRWRAAVSRTSSDCERSGDSWILNNWSWQTSAVFGHNLDIRLLIVVIARRRRVLHFGFRSLRDSDEAVDLSSEEITVSMLSVSNSSG